MFRRRRLLPCRRLPLAAAPSLLALGAALWRGLEAPAAPDASSLLIATDGRRHPGMARRLSSGEVRGGGSGTAEGGDVAGDVPTGGGGEAGGRGAAEGSRGAAVVAAVEQQAQQEAAGHAVLLMGVGSDGRVWQWQLPLLSGELPDAKAAASGLPPAPRPELLGGAAAESAGPAAMHLASWVQRQLGAGAAPHHGSPPSGP